MNWLWIKIITVVIFVAIPGFDLIKNYKLRPKLTVLSLVFGFALLISTLTSIPIPEFSSDKYSSKAIKQKNSYKLERTISDEKQAKLKLQMGVRYLEMDMLKTAKEKLETAEKLDSTNGEVHNVLGVLYERLKQYQRARDQYQQAISLNQDDAGINNNYGRFLCDRGEYQAGMQYLKHALELPLNNRRWFAYTNVGRCELRKGKQELAEINFRQALQENKNYSAALLEMQKISYHSGQYMSARAFLERYLGRSKHNAETLWYAVQTERSLGNRKFAEKYREKLLNLFPTSKEAQQLKLQ